MDDGELDVSFFILSVSCQKQFKTPSQKQKQHVFYFQPFPLSFANFSHHSIVPVSFHNIMKYRKIWLTDQCFSIQVESVHLSQNRNHTLTTGLQPIDIQLIFREDSNLLYGEQQFLYKWSFTDTKVASHTIDWCQNKTVLVLCCGEWRMTKLPSVAKARWLLGSKPVFHSSWVVYEISIRISIFKYIFWWLQKMVWDQCLRKNVTRVKINFTFTKWLLNFIWLTDQTILV